MNTNNILKEILKKISLEPQELKKIEKETKELIKTLQKNNLEANIGGSLAKNTILKKDNQDVDIFVVLKPEQLNNFEKIISKTKIKYELVHGSRDYIKIKKDDLTFELIPVLKLNKNEKIENVTDFSLVHVKYIKSCISKNKNLANEIKLAKAFCYANNCYGAESYIGGFSGYALEVLICHYGGFINFLKRIQKEKVIDPKKYFKGTNEIMRELNQSKLQSPLILIDPTYKYRNVCAGLTNETYNIFLEKSNEFLKVPSEKFFEKEKFNLDEFMRKSKEKSLDIYELILKTNRQEGDIAGTKMKKLFRFLIKELERKKQEVKDSHFDYSGGQEARAYLAIKRNSPIEIVGPKANLKKAVEEFKKVRKQTYLLKGFICAKEEVSVEEIFTNSLIIAESMGTAFDFKKI